MKVFKGRGMSAVQGIFAAAAASMMATAAPAQVTAAPVQSVAAANTVYLGNGTAVTAMRSTASATIAQAPLAIARSLPLAALVAMHTVGAELNEQEDCLAVAVYHEARGESLEGQLAVANVIINRTNSPRYPDSWCAVMKQPWQFSFVNPRTGRYAAPNKSSASWANAQAVARIAANNIAAEVDPDVLWYHADYVSPSWGKRLALVEKIGTHIFYRDHA